MKFYHLQEQSDVFVDACVSDHNAQLLLLSVFGRDTSIQQLMARLHLRTTQGGVDQFGVTPSPGAKPLINVMVGDPNRLEKVTGRMPRTGLLGNLVHAWIFNPVITRLDHATGSGWLLERQHDQGVMSERLFNAMEAQKAWRMVQQLSPVPLLDEWSLTVLSYLTSAGAIRRPLCVGPVKAMRLEVPPQFVTWVSNSVRSGVLPVPNEALTGPNAGVPFSPEAVRGAEPPVLQAA